VSSPGFRLAQTTATDTAAAVREFHEGVAQPALALVVFFCSPRFDLDVLASEMARSFGSVPVVGCTSAGEIGPLGLRSGTIAGASFSTDVASAACACLPDLEHLDTAAAQAFAHELVRQLADRAPWAGERNTFAWQMVDGLSVREELLTRAFQTALRRIPIVGGSAGDGLDFQRTLVYCDGSFHANSAVLALVATPLPFQPFVTQHFEASEQRLVVTRADTARRIVHEIDGHPAAEAYARMVGVDAANLDPMRFAASPVTVMVGGMHYVRSISRALPDGSLRFFCAIDEGMVLRVAHAGDIVANLGEALEQACGDAGGAALILGCDCILRRVEVERRGLADEISALFTRHHVVGFNTYGEQYRGLHLNQTFSGIALGHGPREAGHA